jgi:hypothetical protein
MPAFRLLRVGADTINIWLSMPWISGFYCRFCTKVFVQNFDPQNVPARSANSPFIKNTEAWSNNDIQPSEVPHSHFTAS